MSPESVMKLIEDERIAFVDLRFTDLLGKQHHVSFPAHTVDDAFFEDGRMFDGSSLRGWAGISNSDMVLLPDAETAFVDPFSRYKQLVMICDVLEPSTMQAYARDPRSIARAGEAYLKTSGVADTAFFGPEPEFFIFDSIRWQNDMGRVFYEIESEEAAWSARFDYEAGNHGQRPSIKGGYAPLAPIDSLADIRAEICQTLELLGQEVEVHHHEAATAGQSEIGIKFNTLLHKADEMTTVKYVIRNVAHKHGKTATFMPKPLVGDNGSGMHVHQSLTKDGNNLFAGDLYGGLSQMALWYIGGVFKHARALNAFTNATTNSYKRLVPGFEAPVMLAYSARNRSASCRIPHVSNPKARRVETRFPDGMQSGYLSFTALMMAGLDGIANKIDPGAPADKDLYDLPPEEARNIPQVCASLDAALKALDQDRDFLKAGNVFSDDMIDAYLEIKMHEVTAYRTSTHPLEFDMYYGL